MRNNSVLFTSAIQLSTTATMLIRSILFAHLLSPDDYGLAMTFGVVLLFCEHISNIGHDNFILRSQNGDSESFQATMHSTVLIKGLTVSALLILLAPSVSRLLDLQELDFNYALLAMVPFINAFVHLDFLRVNRQFDYSVSAKLSITSDVISIVLAIGLALLWQNYWAFLVSLISRHLIYVVISHLLATRPYRLSLEWSHLRELLGYGWPIFLISCLRYLSLEADKIIVVRYLGLIEFASYALSFLVVRQATSLSATAYAKIFIRRISQSTNQSQQLYAYKTNAVILLFVTSPVLLALCILGEPLTEFAFGKQYNPTVLLIPSICALMAIRVSGFWLNHIVIASDKTQKMLMSTILRLTGLGLAGVAIVNGFGLITMVGCLAIGEAIYIASLIRSLKTERPELPKLALSVNVFNLLNLITGTIIYWATYEWDIVFKITIAGVSVGALVLAFLCKSTVCRNQLNQLTKSLISFAGIKRSANH